MLLSTPFPVLSFPPPWRTGKTTQKYTTRLQKQLRTRKHGTLDKPSTACPVSVECMAHNLRHDFPSRKKRNVADLEMFRERLETSVGGRLY